MTKAEMEHHHAQYESLIDQSQAARREGLCQKAIQLALAAGEHIDGMMQYERKRADTRLTGFEALNVVLRYGPLLLDSGSLDQVEQLLAGCRRIERNTCSDYRQELAEARARMWQNHKLWNHLEKNADCRQDELRETLGGDQEDWRRTAEMWDEIGLLRRTPEGGSYRLALMTQMREVVKAKCPSCGNVAEAAKAEFLGELPCGACKESVVLVILARG